MKTCSGVLYCWPLASPLSAKFTPRAFTWKSKIFIDEYYEKKDGQSLKNLLDINKKIIKPFKVVTPFQILKWAFGVKGFEKGFTELAGSYLIFDEIHIYNRELFSRILFFIEWLVEKLKVKVFIMTATMPTFMQNHIKQILNITNEIRPSKEDIATIQRHKIKLYFIVDLMEKIEHKKKRKFNQKISHSYL